jgi:hypothetical protein
MSNTEPPTPNKRMRVAAEFHCPICDNYHPERLMYQHVYACLYDSCVEQNIRTYCMCDTCKGRNHHSETPPPAPSKPSLPATTIPSTTFVIERNANQLREVTCFCCDRKKEKKIPIGQDKIWIGKHRHIKFCQKSEIRYVKYERERGVRG